MTSVEQRRVALEKANRVRLARAALKRRIAQGDVTVEQILADPPAEAVTMTVHSLLRSQWRWGTYRCHRFLVSFQISESRTVAELTESQRARMVERLAGGAAALRDAELDEELRRWAAGRPAA